MAGSFDDLKKTSPDNSRDNSLKAHLQNFEKHQKSFNLIFGKLRKNPAALDDKQINELIEYLKIFRAPMELNDKKDKDLLSDARYMLHLFEMQMQIARGKNRSVASDEKPSKQSQIAFMEIMTEARFIDGELDYSYIDALQPKDLGIKWNEKKDKACNSWRDKLDAAQENEELKEFTKQKKNYILILKEMKKHSNDASMALNRDQYEELVSYLQYLKRLCSPSDVWIISDIDDYLEKLKSYESKYNSSNFRKNSSEEASIAFAFVATSASIEQGSVNRKYLEKLKDVNLSESKLHEMENLEKRIKINEKKANANQKKQFIDEKKQINNLSIFDVAKLEKFSRKAMFDSKSYNIPIPTKNKEDKKEEDKPEYKKPEITAGLRRKNIPDSNYINQLMYLVLENFVQYKTIEARLFFVKKILEAMHDCVSKDTPDFSTFSGYSLALREINKKFVIEENVELMKKEHPSSDCFPDPDLFSKYIKLDYQSFQRASERKFDSYIVSPSTVTYNRDRAESTRTQDIVDRYKRDESMYQHATDVDASELDATLLNSFENVRSHHEHEGYIYDDVKTLYERNLRRRLDSSALKYDYVASKDEIEKLRIKHKASEEIAKEVLERERQASRAVPTPESSAANNDPVMPPAPAGFVEVKNEQLDDAVPPPPIDAEEKAPPPLPEVDEIPPPPLQEGDEVPPPPPPEVDEVPPPPPLSLPDPTAVTSQVCERLFPQMETRRRPVTPMDRNFNLDKTTVDAEVISARIAMLKEANFTEVLEVLGKNEKGEVAVKDVVYLQYHRADADYEKMSPINPYEAEIQALQYLQGMLIISSFDARISEQYIMNIYNEFRKGYDDNQMVSAKLTAWMAEQFAQLLSDRLGIDIKHARRQVTMARDMAIMAEPHPSVCTITETDESKISVEFAENGHVSSEYYRGRSYDPETKSYQREYDPETKSYVKGHFEAKWLKGAEKYAGFEPGSSTWLGRAFDDNSKLFEKFEKYGVPAPPSARWLELPSNWQNIRHFQGDFEDGRLKSVRTSDFVRLGTLCAFETNKDVQEQLAKDQLKEVIRGQLDRQIKEYKRAYKDLMVKGKSGKPVFYVDYINILSPVFSDTTALGQKMVKKDNNNHFILLAKKAMQEVMNEDEYAKRTDVEIVFNHTNSAINHLADYSEGESKKRMLGIISGGVLQFSVEKEIIAQKIETVAKLVDLIIVKDKKNLSQEDLTDLRHVSALLREDTKVKDIQVNIARIEKIAQSIEKGKILFDNKGKKYDYDTRCDIATRLRAAYQLKLLTEKLPPFKEMSNSQRNLMKASLELLAQGKQAIKIGGCKSARDRTAILMAAVKTMQEDPTTMYDADKLNEGIIRGLKQGQNFRAMCYHVAVVKVSDVKKYFHNALPVFNAKIKSLSKFIKSSKKGSNYKPKLNKQAILRELSSSRDPADRRLAQLVAIHYGTLKNSLLKTDLGILRRYIDAKNKGIVDDKLDKEVNELSQKLNKYSNDLAIQQISELKSAMDQPENRPIIKLLMEQIKEFKKNMHTFVTDEKTLNELKALIGEAQYPDYNPANVGDVTEKHRKLLSSFEYRQATLEKRQVRLSKNMIDLDENDDTKKAYVDLASTFAYKKIDKTFKDDIASQLGHLRIIVEKYKSNAFFANEMIFNCQNILREIDERQKNFTVDESTSKELNGLKDITENLIKILSTPVEKTDELKTPWVERREAKAELEIDLAMIELRQAMIEGRVARNTAQIQSDVVNKKKYLTPETRDQYNELYKQYRARKIDNFDVQKMGGLLGDYQIVREYRSRDASGKIVTDRVEVETPEKSAKRANELLGEDAYNHLHEGTSRIESTEARNLFLFKLQSALDERKKSGDHTKPTTMKELLGDEGIELYKAAMLEEANSKAFRNAVFLRSVKTYVGPKWAKRLILWIGGPSASGKTFAINVMLGRIASKLMQLGSKDKDVENHVVMIDGAIEREVSQVRQLTVQVGLELGYTGIDDIEDFAASKQKDQTKLKDRVQSAVEMRHEKRDKADKEAHVLHMAIPDTYTKYALKTEGKFKKVFDKYAEDKDTMQVFSEVVSNETTEQKEIFQESVRRMGTSRAFLKDGVVYSGITINNFLIGCESKKYDAGIEILIASKTQGVKVVPMNFHEGRHQTKRALSAYNIVQEKHQQIAHEFKIINDLVFVIFDSKTNTWRPCKEEDQGQIIMTTERAFKAFNEWRSKNSEGSRATSRDDKNAKEDDIISEEYDIFSRWLAVEGNKPEYMDAQLEYFRNGKEVDLDTRTTDEEEKLVVEKEIKRLQNMIDECKNIDDYCKAYIEISKQLQAVESPQARTFLEASITNIQEKVRAAFIEKNPELKASDYSLIAWTDENNKTQYFMAKKPIEGGEAIIHFGYKIDKDGNIDGDEIVVRSLKRRGYDDKRYMAKVADEVKVNKLLYPDSSGKITFANGAVGYHMQIIPGFELAKKPTKNERKFDCSEFKIKDLSFEQRLQVMQDVLKQLEELHKAGYYHADINPTNIKIYIDENNQVHAYLFDFGLTKNLNGGNSITLNNAEGMPEFIAEESVGKVKRFGKASDVYAMAAIIGMLFCKDPNDFIASKLAVGDRLEKAKVTGVEKQMREASLSSYDYEKMFSEMKMDVDDTTKEKIKVYVRKMTDRDPDKRPSIEEALKYFAEVKANAKHYEAEKPDLRAIGIQLKAEDAVHLTKALPIVTEAKVLTPIEGELSRVMNGATAHSPEIERMSKSLADLLVGSVDAELDMKKSSLSHFSIFDKNNQLTKEYRDIFPPGVESYIVELMDSIAKNAIQAIYVNNDFTKEIKSFFEKIEVKISINGETITTTGLDAAIKVYGLDVLRDKLIAAAIQVYSGLLTKSIGEEGAEEEKNYTAVALFSMIGTIITAQLNLLVNLHVNINALKDNKDPPFSNLLTEAEGYYKNFIEKYNIRLDLSTIAPLMKMAVAIYQLKNTHPEHYASGVELLNLLRKEPRDIEFINKVADTFMKKLESGDNEILLQYEKAIIASLEFKPFQNLFSSKQHINSLQEMNQHIFGSDEKYYAQQIRSQLLIKLNQKRYLDIKENNSVILNSKLEEYEKYILYIQSHIKSSSIQEEMNFLLDNIDAAKESVSEEEKIKILDKAYAVVLESSHELTAAQKDEFLNIVTHDPSFDKTIHAVTIENIEKYLKENLLNEEYKDLLQAYHKDPSGDKLLEFIDEIAKIENRILGNVSKAPILGYFANAYIFVREKAEGANQPGEHGGIYQNIGNRSTYLFKQDTTSRTYAEPKHNVEKDISEFVATRMAGQVYKDAIVAPEMVVLKYPNQESPYIGSKFLGIGKDEVYKDLYKDIYENYYGLQQLQKLQDEILEIKVKGVGTIDFEKYKKDSNVDPAYLALINQLENMLKDKDNLSNAQVLIEAHVRLINATVSEVKKRPKGLGTRQFIKTKQGEIFRRAIESKKYNNIEKALFLSALLGDNDMHSENIGVVIKKDQAGNEVRECVRIDFGAALAGRYFTTERGLKLGSSQRLQFILANPTNHFTDYPKSIRYTEKFADAIRDGVEELKKDMATQLKIFHGDEFNLWSYEDRLKFAKYIGMKDPEKLNKDDLNGEIANHVQKVLEHRMKLLQQYELDIRLSLCFVEKNGKIELPSNKEEDLKKLIRESKDHFPDYFTKGTLFKSGQFKFRSTLKAQGFIAKQVFNKKVSDAYQAVLREGPIPLAVERPVIESVQPVAAAAEPAAVPPAIELTAAAPAVALPIEEKPVIFNYIPPDSKVLRKLFSDMLNGEVDNLRYRMEAYLKYVNTLGDKNAGMSADELLPTLIFLIPNLSSDDKDKIILYLNQHDDGHDYSLISLLSALYASRQLKPSNEDEKYIKIAASFSDEAYQKLYVENRIPYNEVGKQPRVPVSEKDKKEFFGNREIFEFRIQEKNYIRMINKGDLTKNQCDKLILHLKKINGYAISEDLSSVLNYMILKLEKIKQKDKKTSPATQVDYAIIMTNAAIALGQIDKSYLEDLISQPEVGTYLAKNPNDKRRVEDALLELNDLELYKNTIQIVPAIAMPVAPLSESVEVKVVIPEPNKPAEEKIVADDSRAQKKAAAEQAAAQRTADKKAAAEQAAAQKNADKKAAADKAAEKKATLKQAADLKTAAKKAAAEEANIQKAAKKAAKEAEKSAAKAKPLPQKERVAKVDDPEEELSKQAKAREHEIAHTEKDLEHEHNSYGESRSITQKISDMLFRRPPNLGLQRMQVGDQKKVFDDKLKDKYFYVKRGADHLSIISARKPAPNELMKNGMLTRECIQYVKDQIRAILEVFPPPGTTIEVYDKDLIQAYMKICSQYVGITCINKTDMTDVSVEVPDDLKYKLKFKEHSALLKPEAKKEKQRSRSVRDEKEELEQHGIFGHHEHLDVKAVQKPLDPKEEEELRGAIMSTYEHLHLAESQDTEISRDAKNNLSKDRVLLNAFLSSAPTDQQEMIKECIDRIDKLILPVSGKEKSRSPH